MPSLLSERLRLRLVAAVFVAATGMVTGCADSTEPSHSNPTTLEAVTATLLEGMVGSEVSPAPTVRVNDRNGNPVQGVPVSFQLTDGGGTLQGSAAATDADGLLTVAWTLGTRTGVGKITASSAGLTNVTFTATATRGPASNLRATGALNGRSGMTARPTDELPAVEVHDRFFNPVAGVAVTFSVTSGGGTIEDGIAITNQDGIATSGRWILGSPGENVVRASAAGLPSATFTVTALAVTGGYELESLVIGSFLLKPPGRIVLAENGEFMTDVQGIIGRGTYEISASAIVLRYADGFLGALSRQLDYWPATGRIEDARETGTVAGTTIVLYRCFTEDCYDSYWTYRKAGP